MTGEICPAPARVGLVPSAFFMFQYSPINSAVLFRKPLKNREASASLQPSALSSNLKPSARLPAVLESADKYTFAVCE